MTKRPKARAKRQIILVVPTTEQTLVEKMKALPPDERRHRFLHALTMALPIMSSDDMDKVEPHLLNVIGRHLVREASKS